MYTVVNQVNSKLTLSGVLLLMFPATISQIVIGYRGSFLRWEGCIYTKVTITKEFGDLCHHCTVDPLQPTMPISITDWVQEFINCTDHCDRGTICTRALYYTSKDDPPTHRPLCYQCENLKNEVIWFESKYEYELCPYDCRGCAELVDLTDATKCAATCKGHPTFCFPVRKAFGQRICFQASHWYGCDYVSVYPNATSVAQPFSDNHGYGHQNKDEEEVIGGELTEQCLQCAKEAKTTQDAQYCSYACSSYPTFHDGQNYKQCRPHVFVNDKHNDLFLYNIPNEILEYMHVSNASFLYPNEMLNRKRKVYDGTITKQISRPFNIAEFNRPIPYKYRIGLSDPDIIF